MVSAVFSCGKSPVIKDSDQLAHYLLNCKQSELNNLASKRWDFVALPHFNSQDFISYELLLPTTNISEHHSTKKCWLWQPVSFLKNLCETFFDAFSFFDQSDPPASIYEKNQVISIYIKFLTIPYLIANTLHCFFNSLFKAYFVASAIILAAWCAVNIFDRYLKPIPDEIPFCENLQHSLNKIECAPGNFLSSEIDRLISFTSQPEKCKPLLIVNESGAGKTTLVKTLLHKMQTESSLKLKDKRVFVLHSGSFTAKSNMGISDKLKVIKNKLAGKQKNVVLFIDEIQAFLAPPSNFELLKEFIRGLEVKVIAATTDHFFKEIKELDKDGSFLRSIEKFSLQSWDDERLEVQLKEIIWQKAGDLIIKDCAVEKIIDTAGAQSDYAKHAFAIDLLHKVIEANRRRYTEDEQPVDELLIKFKNLQLDYLNDKLDKTANWQSLKTKITEIKKRNREVFLDKQKLKTMLSLKWQAQKIFTKLAHQSTPSKMNMEYLAKLKLSILPGVSQAIDGQVSKLNKMVVDADFVESVLKNV